MSEARAHPHNVARGTFVDVDGAPQPAPGPALRPHPERRSAAPVAAGTDTDTALVDWGFTADEVARLEAVRRRRVIYPPAFDGVTDA